MIIIFIMCGFFLSYGAIHDFSGGLGTGSNPTNINDPAIFSKSQDNLVSNRKTDILVTSVASFLKDSEKKNSKRGTDILNTRVASLLKSVKKGWVC